DVMNEESDVAKQLAGSAVKDVILPSGDSDESFSGPIFYSMAKLRPIQLIEKASGKLSEPQTIPPYFSACRSATKADVARIYPVDAENKEGWPFKLNLKESTPEDLIIALQNLTPAMVDALYQIDKTKGGRDLITAIKQASMEELGEERAHEMSLAGLKRRIGRLDRLPFLSETGKDAFGQMADLIRDGKSVVLDFGDYGTDPMVYLFVANVISRRLFDLYTERNAEFPRLILFLEEAHKFLDPAVADLAPTFSRLARETRKFNLILALIDQRPARISDEVRSQLANRF